jgi:mono/diheme cytochrome c family protein
MGSQPRYNPLSKSDFFGDDLSARPLPADTVARGHLRDGSLLYTGKVQGTFADLFPFPIDEAALRRGKERFEIYCTPCHGRTGHGDGVVVKRGYRQPPSFHIERLRKSPAGYFFDVVTNGFGAMPDYAVEVSVEDRWRIVAYVRALQLSESVPASDLTPDQQTKVEAGATQ